MDTKQAISIFLKAKEAKALSRETLSSYRYRLGLFSRLCPDLPTKVEVLEDFLLKTGPTPETRDTYYRLLRNLFRFLYRRQYIPSNPIEAVEPIRLKRKIARALTPEELTQLLQHPSHNATILAFLYLLADTGLRLSEALSIKGSDNFHGDILIAKGKTGEREVPISPEVKGMVLAVLPWSWSHWQTAGLAVRRAFKRAGFSGPRASAHSLRHTFCRLWEGDESILVGIMGWTSPRMLTRYRPYNLARAQAQHIKYSPIQKAKLAIQRQLALF